MMIQAGIPDCWRGQLWHLFLASLTAGYNRELRTRRYKQLTANVSDSESACSLTGRQDGKVESNSGTYQAHVHLVR